MTRAHRLLATVAAVLAFGAAMSAIRPPQVSASKLAADIEAERDHISALDLAERLMRSDKTLRVYDLRSKGEFDTFHVPSAEQISIEDLATKPLPHDSDIVLYSEGGAHAAQAWVLLRLRGYQRVTILREGLYEWQSRVLEPRLATDPTAAERAEFDRAVPLSRFFGGTSMSGVPRSEIPQGYWTSSPQSPRPANSTAGPIRRRGC